MTCALATALGGVLVGCDAGDGQVQVWLNAEGDAVSTSIIHSERGDEHCGWADMTFLFIGKNGRDGEFYGTPPGDLQNLLTMSYEDHVALPADAGDSGFHRDGRELWVARDGRAAYLVAEDGDVQQWPGPSGEPIRCQ
jgi:hypothetical protein